MRWKHHSEAEIASKLAKANELAATGALQREIADALGISVMTYHRWRRLWSERASARELDSGSFSVAEAAKLKVENSLLRRIVTDLLLEKIELEEQISAKARAHSA